MLLRQPDASTCGSCCAVRARMALDDGYDTWVRADAGGTRFRQEALAAHRRTNRAVDASGRPQLPWPLALGTSPWALARELTLVSGTRYVVRPVPPWRREAAYLTVLDAAAGGDPVPVYVGNALAPRHVVLVLAGDGGLGIYDPAAGRDVRVAREAWVTGRLGLSGWDLPWFVVSPAARRTPA